MTTQEELLSVQRAILEIQHQILVTARETQELLVSEARAQTALLTYLVEEVPHPAVQEDPSWRRSERLSRRAWEANNKVEQALQRRGFPVRDGTYGMSRHR